MAQLQLWWTNNSGSSTKKYIIEGMLNVSERKSQQSIDLPFPLLNDNATIINSIFGQKRVLNCSFIIMQRSDDYTNSTGTPSTKSPYEQKTWLLDTIFVASGYHRLYDEEGNYIQGRVEDMDITRSGDDPIKYDATFTFKRGLVPIAGQFSPFT